MATIERLPGDALDEILWRVERWVARLTCGALRKRCARAHRNSARSALGSPERCRLALELGMPADWVWRGVLRNGNLRMVEWADSAGYALCKKSSESTAIAAAAGYLHTLGWLRSRGFASDERTTTAAARAGQLGALKWCVALGCAVDDDDAAVAAAQMGRVETLEWLWCLGRLTYGSLVRATAAAAGGGHLEMLRWALERGWPFDESACRAAASAGRLDILKWLRRVADCEWDAETIEVGIHMGHARLVKWAASRGCEPDEWACAAAAANGDLGLLRWLRTELGCAMDESTCAAAARGGFLHVLKWARAHGCAWDGATLCGARAGSHFGVLEWARAHGCPRNFLGCRRCTGWCTALNFIAVLAVYWTVIALPTWISGCGS